MAKNPPVTLFKTTTADKVLKATAKVMGVGSTTQGFSLLPPVEERYLVRITVNVSNGRKLEAEEVYIDDNGDPQTFTGNRQFTVALGDPVFSPNAISVGDVVEISGAARPSGEEYWLASAAGGSASSSTVSSKLVTNKNAVSAGTSGVFDDDAEDLGEFADITALNTAYPTGTSTQAAKVLTDGFYYTWSGSAWTSTASSTLPTVEYTWKVSVNVNCAASKLLLVKYAYVVSSGLYEWRADDAFPRVMSV